MQERYVSMFKINGTPILPPLMTAARRREMLAYKELAMALETRLKLESDQASDAENLSTIENEYMKVSNLLQDHFRPTRLKNRQIKGLTNPAEFLKKSDTFIYDIKTNTVIIPGDKEMPVGDGGNTGIGWSTANTKLSNICQVGKEPSPQKMLTRKTSTPTKSSKIIKHVAPSISIQPATPETKTKEIAISSTPLSQRNIQTGSEIIRKKTPRASTSPSLKDSSSCLSAPPLVRSNSFTLDGPSPVLLEHMVRNRTKNAEIPEKTQIITPPEPLRRKKVRPEGFVIKVSPPKQPPPVIATAGTTTPVATSSEQPKLSTLLITNSGIFKNRKSPYESKTNGKSKVVKKHKTPTKKISAIALRPRLSTTHHRSRLLIGSPFEKVEKQKSPPPPSNAQKLNTVEQFNEIEERHRLKLMELIKRQQDEQRLMQETFERQQKQLLEEFNAGLMSLQLPSALNPDSSAEEKNNNSNNNHNSTPKKTFLTSLEGSEYFDMTDTLAMPTNNSTKSTPRCTRRLFATSNQSAPPPTPRQRMATSIDTRIPSPTRRRVEGAATIINAYAKGYLVRRLFNTDHVQNIVQTIRDTLLFVLDFHRETENDTTEENIAFKARLLQQLTSACHSLHAVFFSLSVKERMEIIAKDRIYIQNKAKGRNKYAKNQIIANNRN